MDDVRNGNWNVLPDEPDDPELDAAWATLDPAEIETLDAELDAVFGDAEGDRSATDRMNAGFDDDDARLHPDVASDEGAPDEFTEVDNETVDEDASLADDPTVIDEIDPTPV